MNYKKYQNSRDAAWQILIDQNISVLPVRVTLVCKRLGIPIRMYDGEGDGYGLWMQNKYVIFLNRDRSTQRQRFTIAHELGHILLDHSGKFDILFRDPFEKGNLIEQEANVFASRLLAPACVLHELGAFYVERIMQLCDISREFAQYRLNRLFVLEHRDKQFRKKYGYGCFYLNPLERKIKEQFQKYIDKNKL